MSQHDNTAPTVQGPVDRPVRPAAWLREQRDMYEGRETLDPFFVLGWPQPKNFAHGATYEPLYDKAALNAAVATERERIRRLLRAEQAHAADCLEGKAYRAAHDACGAVLQKV